MPPEKFTPHHRPEKSIFSGLGKDLLSTQKVEISSQLQYAYKMGQTMNTAFADTHNDFNHTMSPIARPDVYQN